ncbi:hypothetical protein BZA77DRAFT_309184 [Pyronema omphalodes]|nr:hypothetical protein BZA77DRAFT_309184 [Pyronema omphalodes]
MGNTVERFFSRNIPISPVHWVHESHGTHDALYSLSVISLDPTDLLFEILLTLMLDICYAFLRLLLVIFEQFLYSFLALVGSILQFFASPLHSSDLFQLVKPIKLLLQTSLLLFSFGKLLHRFTFGLRDLDVLFLQGR